MSDAADSLEDRYRARAAIELAIATLKEHRGNLTEGQIKEIKRILYGVPQVE